MIKAPPEWELLEGCYLTKEIMEALHRESGTHLAELEPVGLSERTTNALERAGIHTLGDLLFFAWDGELERVHNMGDGAHREILKAISLLDRLEELADKHMAKLMPNRDKIEAIRDWGLEAVLAGAY